MKTEIETARLALIERALFFNELTDAELVVALHASGLPEIARVLDRTRRLTCDRPTHPSGCGEGADAR